MPFLVPLIPAIVGLASAGAGIGGVIEGAQAGNRQQKALTQQEQIAQQEMGDKQKIFDLLQPFFQQYLGAGSPFLAQMQRASAEQNAQSFNNAAGQVRNTMATSGMGFGPSGATAAAEGGLAAEAAKTSSSDYLTNLLNNEKLKFTAAQGLQGIGQMAGSSQNQPSVSTQLPYQSTASGLFGLSQALQNLLGNSSGVTGGTPGSAPGSGTITVNSGGIPGVGPGGVPTPVPQIPYPGMPGSTGAPSTTGYTPGMGF